MTSLDRKKVVVTASGQGIGRATAAEQVVAAALEHYEVARVVNSPANDGPECVARLAA